MQSRYPKSMPLKWLPNTLTILRCLLAFWVGWQIVQLGSGAVAGWVAFIWFVGVAATDFADGLAARKLNAVSALGAFLDPVADKLLVAASLLGLCFITAWPWWLWVPTALIVSRDVFVTLVRLRPGVQLPVTRLAKWKTAAEMAGIAGYLLTYQISVPGLWALALGLIWLAALMSAYTGALYLRSAAGRSG